MALPDNQDPGDGYPTPDAAQLAAIEVQADGTLSNAPASPPLHPDSLPVFQLIAFNEFFEVAFFTSLLDNVTRRVDGFDLRAPAERALLERVLPVVRAQEELHALAAVDVLRNSNVLIPQPCVYAFPTADVYDALALAATLTSVVLGTLQDGAQALAAHGDDGPVRTLAAVLGQEGEQNGFYRTLLQLLPSEKPFLTTGVAAYAFSALQPFVVTCPFDLARIPLPVFPALQVRSGRPWGGAARVSPADQTLAFAANLSGIPGAADLAHAHPLFVTYLTGQDRPISEPITKAAWSGDMLSFEALFPFDEFIMDGLTMAALTTGGNFSHPDELPAQTLAAPGLIQVDVALEY